MGLLIEFSFSSPIPMSDSVAAKWPRSVLSPIEELERVTGLSHIDNDDVHLADMGLRPAAGAVMDQRRPSALGPSPTS
jgi:hypothetical protein